MADSWKGDGDFAETFEAGFGDDADDAELGGADGIVLIESGAHRFFAGRADGDYFYLSDAGGH